MSLQEHMKVYEDQGLDRKEAMKRVLRTGASEKERSIRHYWRKYEYRIEAGRTIG